MEVAEQLEIPSLEKIEAEINQIDIKKDDLKKAFDSLQVESSLLSSFVLSWSDLDAHVISVKNELINWFKLLESVKSTSPCDSLLPDRKWLVRSDGVQRHDTGKEPIVASRQDLVVLCDKMDGKGLLRYVDEHSEERDKIQAELRVAMSAARDPCLLVLEALQHFQEMMVKAKGSMDKEFVLSRRSTFTLLDVLAEIKPSLNNEVRESVRKIAMEWKDNAKLDSNKPAGVFDFLKLLLAFGLQNEFAESELVDYYFAASKFRNGPALCRALGVGEKTASDIAQKLVDASRYLRAIVFVVELGLTNKFPPVAVLETYVKEIKKMGKKIRKDGNNSEKSQKHAVNIQLEKLKLIQKFVSENSLESCCPMAGVEARITTLEHIKKTTSKRLPSPAKHWKGQKLAMMDVGMAQNHPNKRRRSDSPTVPSYYHHQFQQPVGLLPSYGVMGGSSLAPPTHTYSSSAYSSSAAAASLGNVAGPGIGFYSSEPHGHVPSSLDYLDRRSVYDGYGLSSQYLSSYYP